MRATDYLEWGAMTVLAPVLYNVAALQHDGRKKFSMPAGRPLRASLFVGFISGFFSAYAHTAMRLSGVRENAREVKMDRYEIKKALSEYRLPYGEPTMAPHSQKTATRASSYSWKMIDVYPSFNWFNHPYHTDDFSKYYDVRKGEEDWGFDSLPTISEIKRKIAAGKEHPQDFIDKTKEYLWKY
ncbi:hypothetical protein BABINDRAFT_159903 [Babjeviella inositovora NRRL Y-12698]|uniref:Uncharacterized protein n=1 Tax=Babjeviella inositovora NRRL Y-12698 TaxID=984486 RepID=A0A1E3QVF3_9ASCO|nr:uncharacterized protein BABINDRAFT_159903 [Babjeviella inositovora NRRL Y-12698]ODQ81638.1 hypothetical protein BABINDRAFT_159903 [Babjeviella inositovora NRRL Y-12698]